jgi:hypothetical protein
VTQTDPVRGLSLPWASIQHGSGQGEVPLFEMATTSIAVSFFLSESMWSFKLFMISLSIKVRHVCCGQFGPSPAAQRKVTTIFSLFPSSLFSLLFFFFFTF